MLQLKATLESPDTNINWDDLDALAQSPEASSSGVPASPPTAWLDQRDMPMYGAAPLEQAIPLIRCKDCDKPILASALSTHKSNCEKIRKASGKNKKDVPITTGSKRKAEDDSVTDIGSGPPKKKGKKEMASKGSKRIKGPISLDKHCCVINDKGQPCSRSITCKVHSMVAKRAVQGRSKSYDELLLDWKRENIAGFVEPVKRETKAERKAKKEAEKEAKRLEAIALGVVPGAKKAKAAKGEGGKKAKKAEKGATGEKGGKKAVKSSANAGEDDDEEEDVDSDVELESLVRAVRAARPFTAVPLARPDNVSNFFVARNEILRNCHDSVGFGLSGGNIRGHNMAVAAS